MISIPLWVFILLIVLSAPLVILSLIILISLMVDIIQGGIHHEQIP